MQTNTESAKKLVALALEKFKGRNGDLNKHDLVQITNICNKIISDFGMRGYAIRPVENHQQMILIGYEPNFNDMVLNPIYTLG